MFAVPGWAVSANSLKVETNKSSGPPAAAAVPVAAGAAGQDEPRSDNNSNNKTKKRKRPNALPSNVTAANLADMWERVIEGKSVKKPKTAKDPKKQQQQQQQQQNGDHVKKQSAVGQENGGDAQQSGKKAGKKAKKDKSNAGKQDENVQGEEKVANAEGDGDEAQPEASAKKSKKDKKKEKKNKQAAEKQDDDPDKQQQEEKAHTAAITTTAAAPPPPPAPKLTPMQAAMREKLISARFRHLNETLYTRPSAEAFQLFQESPEMFREYHEGFRRQVDVWPENPVDGYIAEIQLRGRVKTPATPRRGGHGRGDRDAQRQQQQPVDSGDAGDAGGVPPLPRNQKGTCTIADLGCGDAKLAAALDAEPSSRKKQLRVEVLSYDLHGDADEGGNPRVTRADIANLPRKDGSVEVAVFCLALMGTNWLDFVEEAYRVLRWKGELWVAEIKSRFAAKSTKKHPGGGNNSNGVVSHSVGNRRKPGAGGKKGGKKDVEEDGAEHEAELAIEVDGAEDRRGETDVSGFVEALRRRGFVLQGEPDLRNRMFVRMRFVKAASATVGKCAAPDAAATGAAAAPQDRHQHGHGRGGRPSLVQKRDALKKFLETDGPAGAEGDRARALAEERAILKPCVYKIR